MSDLTDWINERRNIHNAATGGTWAATEDEAWGDTYVSLPIQRVGEAWDSDPAHACCDPLDTENAEAIVDAHNTLPNLLTAVEKVLELHEPKFFGTKYEGDKEPELRYVCMECQMYSPCPTVRSIEGAINE